MGAGSPVDLHSHDARLVSVAGERGSAPRAKNHRGGGTASDDQDQPVAVQSLHPVLPSIQAETAAQNSRLATQNPAADITG